ncbi:MAG: hypothetical protein MZV64_49145 [Ignavibacteriales bacterium]|nr:hypothetical protein [Ignavibacteriales bacterium]
MEGTRPLLVEVQALVAPTSYGVPQRTGHRVRQQASADDPCRAGEACRSASGTVRCVRERGRRCAHR